MTAKLGFIGIVVRDMPASLEFYRALGVSVPEGQTGEPHVDTRLEDGTVLAWDTVAMILRVPVPRDDGPGSGDGDRAQQPVTRLRPQSLVQCATFFYRSSWTAALTHISDRKVG